MRLHQEMMRICRLKRELQSQGYQMYVCVGRELPCAPVKFIKL